MTTKRDDNDRLRGGDLAYDPFDGAVPITAPVRPNGTLRSQRLETGSQRVRELAEVAEPQLPESSQDTQHASSVAWDPPLPLDPQSALPTFPVGVLPPWLREYVSALATATQTPVDMPAMLVLAVLALACAKRLVVRARPGWTEPANLWVVVALPPANRKSVVFSSVARPIREFERDQAARLRPAADAARLARQIAEGRVADATTKATKAQPSERAACEEEAQRLAAEARALRVPVAPRLYVDDVTPERLAQLLADHGGRMAILSAEGGIFSILAGRYAQKSSQNNFDVFLKGHAGDALRVDRVSREATTVEAPALTLGLAVQPEILLGLANQRALRGRGLLARFLFAVPASLLGRRDVNAAPVPPGTEARYDRYVRTLLEALTPSEETPEQEPTPTVVELSSEANEALVAFQGELEPRLARGQPFADVGDWIGKLAGAVVRIAGLLHVADAADQPAEALLAGLARPVSADAVRRAVEVGRYLIPHALAAFDQIAADARYADAQAVVDWLRTTGRTTVTRSDVQQAHRRRFAPVERVDPVLQVLLEHGYLRPAPPAARRTGRPPSPAFLVSPLVSAGSH